jgi:hypothetical protein
MIIFINFKEGILHLEDFFDIVRDFLKVETNHETQISSNKILFKILKYFLKYLKKNVFITNNYYLIRIF